jgi:uncharacterized membrane protein YhaH (DUF805 family)
MDINHLYTSFAGRISRKPFWIGGLVLGVVVLIIVFAIGFIEGLLYDEPGRGFRIVIALVQIAALFPYAALLAKRFHDRDRSGWFAALLLVPSVLFGLTTALGFTGDALHKTWIDYAYRGLIAVILVWFLVELGVLRGTAGSNRYGPDPLKPTA